MGIYRGEKRSRVPVELWACTGRANQKWRAENGMLVNPASGKCLDDPRLNAKNGIQLEIWTCRGGPTSNGYCPSRTELSS